MNSTFGITSLPVDDDEAGSTDTIMEDTSQVSTTAQLNTMPVFSDLEIKESSANVTTFTGLNDSLTTTFHTDSASISASAPILVGLNDSSTTTFHTDSASISASAPILVALNDSSTTFHTDASLISASAPFTVGLKNSPTATFHTDSASISASAPYLVGLNDSSTISNTDAASISASAPLLVVVSIIAFLTIALLFVGMVRYWFCKRASYKINEMYELDDMENGTKLITEDPVNVVTVYGGDVKKEWLV